MVSIEDIKLPPHHIEAEKSIIAGVLMDAELMHMYESLALKSDDFYKREHGYIFGAMMQLWDKRGTIDAVTLSDQLTKNNVLDDIGGIDYLYELSTYLLSTSSCAEYAQIVKEKAVLRNILRVCQGIIGEVYEQKDTLEILEAIEKKIFGLTQLDVGSGIQHIKDILTSRVDDYMEIVDNPEKADLHKTFAGYAGVDTLLSGFKPGELIILAARPSMGKTALALNFVLNAAVDQGKTVGFFSLEMSAEQIVDRLLSSVAAIPMGRISKGDLNDTDFVTIGDSIEKLGETSLYIDDKGNATISQLRSKLRRLQVEKGQLDLVVIDYLQLMSGAGTKFAGNRVLEVSELSRSLKLLAQELKVPIMVLSQLSRAVESRVDKQPMLSDLRDSGAIEQDADSVLMLYREEYYDQDTDRKGATDVLIKKNRNGPVGDVELYFDKTTMKFHDMTHDGDGTY